MADLAELKEIYSQFKKDELLKVSTELEMGITPEKPIRDITKAILDNLEGEGIPEDLDVVSDTLYEFLVVAGFIDEDGNILGEEGDDEESEETIEIPDWICFGYADTRDPACGKCKLFAACKVKRISSRPECFGISYNANEPECHECIEAPFCKKELQDKEN